jgi:CBS domain-containing protein
VCIRKCEELSIMFFSEKGHREKIKRLTKGLEERKLPLVNEKSNLNGVIDAMIGNRHSRLLYVVDDDGKLVGTISLAKLVRHVFSRSHEPQVHPRRLMHAITSETAKDLMQKHPVFAREEEEFETVVRRMIKSSATEIAVVDSDKKVVSDLTLVDLLKFLAHDLED